MLKPPWARIYLALILALIVISCFPAFAHAHSGSGPELLIDAQEVGTREMAIEKISVDPKDPALLVLSVVEKETPQVQEFRRNILGPLFSEISGYRLAFRGRDEAERVKRELESKNPYRIRVKHGSESADDLIFDTMAVYYEIEYEDRVTGRKLDHEELLAEQARREKRERQLVNGEYDWTLEDKLQQIKDFLSGARSAPGEVESVKPVARNAQENKPLDSAFVLPAPLSPDDPFWPLESPSLKEAQRGL